MTSTACQRTNPILVPEGSLVVAYGPADRLADALAAAAATPRVVVLSSTAEPAGPIPELLDGTTTVIVAADAVGPDDLHHLRTVASHRHLPSVAVTFPSSRNDRRTPRPHRLRRDGYQQALRVPTTVTSPAWALVRRPRRAELGLVTDSALDADVVPTRIGGNVRIQRARTRQAYEQLARRSVDWRHLCWIQPTISPVDANPDRDVLEHVTDAVAHYAQLGVTSVHVEEMHLGRHLTVAVYRDERSAAARTGDPAAPLLVGWDRQGRPVDLPAAWEGRLHDQASAAGLFDAADWVLLAGELLDEHHVAGRSVSAVHVPTATAARAVTDALGTLAGDVATRGVDTGDLLTRARTLDADLARFEAAVRTLQGTDRALVLALHTVAAAGDEVTLTRPRAWHHDTIGRVVGAGGPGSVVAGTAHVVVDPASGSDQAAAVELFDRVAGAGGGGVVVKPSDGQPVRLDDRPRFGPPALKVRAGWYLELLYGPGYGRRLRWLARRPTKRKRRLSATQWALGHEALRRFCDGDGPGPVIEAVLAVRSQACEPIDVRL